MTILSLETYRHLFKDENALEAFATVLDASTKDDETPLVVFRNKHILTALSPEAAEKFLSDRILRRIVEKPELLEKLTKRLKELKPSDIVD